MSEKGMAENLENQRGDGALASDIDDAQASKKIHRGVREARNFTIETHIPGKLFSYAVKFL